MKREVKIFLAGIADVMLIITVVLLLAVDKIVNGTLYYYGLVFSHEWSFPYEIFFDVTIILLIILTFLVPIVIITQLDE